MSADTAEISATDLSAAFSGLAVLGILLAILHATLHPGFYGYLEALLIGSIGIIPLYYGTTVRDHQLSDEGHMTALKLTLAGTTAVTTLASAMLLLWWFQGFPHNPWSELISMGFVVGAAMSSVASLYVVDSRESLRTANELATLLTINQRVMRHNYRNKLNIVFGHLRELDNHIDSSATESLHVAREQLEELLETTETAQQIVSIWESDAEQQFSLTSIIEEELSTLTAEYPELTVRVQVPDDLAILAHPEFPNAFSECLFNAAEHNGEDVSITIETSGIPGTDVVELTIRDTGRGLPPIEREVLADFDETSLKHSQGIGLWYIYWVLRKSAGELDIEANDPTGTIIRMTLRVAPHE